MISLKNRKILTPLQKLPKSVGDLGKLMDHRVFVFFTRWSYIKGKHLDKLGSLHSHQQKIVCF